MVLDLNLKVCLVLLFAGGPGDWTPPSLRAGSKTASAPKARRPDTASLILGMPCVYSPGKPLAGLSPLALLPAMGTNAHRFLLANTQGKPTESQCS